MVISGHGFKNLYFGSKTNPDVSYWDEDVPLHSSMYKCWPLQSNVQGLMWFSIGLFHLDSLKIDNTVSTLMYVHNKGMLIEMPFI